MTSPAICSLVFPPPSFTPWNNSSSNGRVFKSPSPRWPGRFSASPGCSPPPGRYKRARSTPGHHHTHPHPPLLAPESATPTSLRTDRRRTSLSTVPSFPHLLSSDEPTNVLATTSSTSPAPSPMTLSPGVTRGQAPVSSRAWPWCRSMLNRRCPWFTNCGLGPRVFRQ
jgi:hypothetical protein